MKTKHRFLSLISTLCLLFFITSCSDEEVGKGDVQLEITDAPIDDANVDAVMVTIADVKVDGESVSGFEKQTINLKAYQDGNTKALATILQLDARSHNNLTLVIDLDHDASGNTPGSYVRLLDNSKYKLKTTATGLYDLTINKSWSVASNALTTIVLDFDLRKSIVYSANSEEKYKFVSETNLNNSVRVISKADAGVINGTYTESISSGADDVIVYAYKKGTFNLEKETSPQGADGLMFANAISSTKVKSSLSGNTFTLALLPEGEYELYFAKYNENTDNEMEFTALLDSETTVNGNINNSVTLHANLTTSVAVSITGLL